MISEIPEHALSQKVIFSSELTTARHKNAIPTITINTRSSVIALNMAALMLNGGIGNSQIGIRDQPKGNRERSTVSYWLFSAFSPFLIRNSHSSDALSRYLDNTIDVQ